MDMKLSRTRSNETRGVLGQPAPTVKLFSVKLRLSLVVVRTWAPVCALMVGSSHLSASVQRLGQPEAFGMSYIAIRTPAWKIIVPLALLFLIFVVDLPQSVAQDGNHNAAAPTVLIEKNGLDPTGNPIDRLLYVFGQCSKIIRQYYGRCTTEEELSLLVDTLPHDARGLSEALTALGARCDAEKKQKIPVDCLYQKKVQIVGWVYGESKPRNIIYQNYAIHITATFVHGIMHHHVELNNPSELDNPSDKAK